MECSEKRSKMKNQSKLKGKDLINIGIYAAIYCVIMTAVAMLGFIPIMMPMLCVLVPLIGGTPMMLFMTKVNKFGMITIYSMIVGLFLWITGMGYWPFIFGIVFGFLADLIAKSGSYKSSKKAILSCGVFNILIFGNFVPLFSTSVCKNPLCIRRFLPLQNVSSIMPCRSMHQRHQRRSRMQLITEPAMSDS